ncbi:HNH endonuclease [Pseudomonas mendocina]|nr:HNH endonuclease [Pseudomonas mendocina]MBH3338625.1 HNH endonuclease [Pseudomonas mendocina]
MLTCIYCQTATFESGKGSEEHVILSSLGGRKGSRNICCQACNNRLGDEIDEELSKELSFFSTMLGITTGRNKPSPTHKNAISHDGNNYDISHGGSLKLSGADVKIEGTDDPKSKFISITASNEEQALKLFEKVLVKFNKSIDDLQEIEAKSVTTYLPEVHRRISLGGEKQMRAIAKMMLTYAATLIKPERLRSGCFNPIIDYINGRNPGYEGIQFDSVTPFPKQPFIDETNHRIFFATSESRKLAIGLIEIYGKLRISAILSYEWEGPSLFKSYAIDPVSQEQENIDMPVSEEIFNSLAVRKMDINYCVSAIGGIVQTFQNRQSDKIISEITTKSIEKHMIGKGEFVTKEMIDQVSREVALEFTRFFYRLDNIEDFQLKK